MSDCCETPELVSQVVEFVGLHVICYVCNAEWVE